MNGSSEGSLRSDVIEEVLTGNSVFKNKSVLDHNYIPPELQARAQELRQLARAYQTFTKKEETFAVHLVIIGESSTGKTLVAKFFCNRLMKYAKSIGIQINALYYNCFSHNTVASILQDVARQHGFNGRGLSNLDILAILKIQLKRSGQKLILIIDEANIPKPEKVGGLIQSTSANGLSGNSQISIMLIARLSHVWKLLDSRIAGVLTKKFVFEKYTENEIKDILSHRIKLGLKNHVVSNGILEEIVQIATSRKNLHHALAILRSAGEMVDEMGAPQITLDILQQVRKGVLYESILPLLQKLSFHALLAINAISRRLANKGIKATTINEIYGYYRTDCQRYRAKPRQKPTFRRIIGDLVQRNIIAAKVGKLKASPGRRMRITGLYPPKVLKELASKIFRIYFGKRELWGNGFGVKCLKIVKNTFLDKVNGM